MKQNELLILALAAYFLFRKPTQASAAPPADNPTVSVPPGEMPAGVIGVIG